MYNVKVDGKAVGQNIPIHFCSYCIIPKQSKQIRQLTEYLTCKNVWKFVQS